MGKLDGGGADAPGTITALLFQVRDGRASEEQLFDVVHQELLKIASGCVRHERQRTLDSHALVNEMYLRLDVAAVLERAESRRYFYAAVKRAMRCVLVDRARSRQRLKREGRWSRIPLDDALDTFEAENAVDLLWLDTALGRLKALHPLHNEIVEMRFFAGMTIKQIAECQGCSASKVEKSLKFSRAWLKRELEEPL